MESEKKKLLILSCDHKEHKVVTGKHDSLQSLLNAYIPSIGFGAERGPDFKPISFVSKKGMLE